jgi:hypothetical protein
MVHAPVLDSEGMNVWRADADSWKGPLSVPVDDVGQAIFQSSFHQPKPPIDLKELVTSKSADWKLAGFKSNARSVAAMRYLMFDQPNEWANAGFTWLGAAAM